MGKLEEHSNKNIMVGYATNHSEDVYYMYNLGTKQVILICDVIQQNGPIKIPKKT